MDHIEKELEAGRAVILPTETVYGIFAKALDQEAVDYICTSRRNERKPASASAIIKLSFDGTVQIIRQ